VQVCVEQPEAQEIEEEKMEWKKVLTSVISSSSWIKFHERVVSSAVSVQCGRKSEEMCGCCGEEKTTGDVELQPITLSSFACYRRSNRK
jgi:hypothetical protein